MSQQPFNSDGGFSTTGNITANYILGTVSTAGNVVAGNFIGSGANVDIVAGAYDWIFDNTGNLTAPGIITANTFVSNAFNVVTAGNLFISSQYGLGTVGTILEQDGLLEFIGNSTGGCVLVGWNSNYGSTGNVAQVYFNRVGGGEGNAIVTTGNTAGTTYEWNFDKTGNLTLPGNTFAVNYANGTAVSLGGAGSYGNADVAAFLAAYGSNTISTTGTITSGNVLANGYARLTGSFDESQASTAGLYLGYAGGTPRIMFGTGNTSQTFEIDNDGGNLRFYQPGSTKATLTSNGVFSANVVVTTPTALSSLTAVAGARAFVNNGNLVAAGNFGAQIGGGGSNTVPVWSDGTNWYIG
jgi:hypothetical protein